MLMETVISSNLGRFPLTPLNFGRPVRWGKVERTKISWLKTVELWKE